MDTNLSEPEGCPNCGDLDMCGYYHYEGRVYCSSCLVMKPAPCPVCDRTVIHTGHTSSGRKVPSRAYGTRVDRGWSQPYTDNAGEIMCENCWLDMAGYGYRSRAELIEKLDEFRAQSRGQ